MRQSGRQSDSKYFGQLCLLLFSPKKDKIISSMTSKPESMTHFCISFFYMILSRHNILAIEYSSLAPEK